MKATLEFDLPEERFDHALATSAFELYRSLREIQDSIRKTLKYSEHSDATRAILEDLRSLIPFDVLAHIDGG